MHLDQLNLARALAPTDDLLLANFETKVGRVNSLLEIIDVHSRKRNTRFKTLTQQDVIDIDAVNFPDIHYKE